MDSKPYTVVVWGDSIAAGTGEMNWPELCQGFLNVVINTGRPAKVINAGVCGKPATYARQEFSERIAPHAPDLVIIQFGFNDIRHDGTRGELPLGTPDEFAESLQDMIQSCREEASAQVVVLGNHRPHANLTMPTGLSYDEARVKYNEIAHAIAERSGAAYYDMSQVVSASDFCYKEIVCEDGVHLSKIGFHFYAGFVAGVVKDFMDGRVA